jgi:hypothetical protein
MIGAYAAVQQDQNVARIIDQSVMRARGLVAVNNVRGGAMFSHATECASQRTNAEWSRNCASEFGSPLGSDRIIPSLNMSTTCPPRSD